MVFTKNRYYIVDFYIHAKPKLLIEIDGSSHIGKEAETYDRQREKEILSTRTYKKSKFLRLTNEQILSGEGEEILSEIYAKIIRRRKKKKAKQT